MQRAVQLTRRRRSPHVANVVRHGVPGKRPPRSDAAPEYTRAVAAHVDYVIRQLPGFGSLEPFRAATLAALAITDELLRTQEELSRLTAEVERRTAEVAALLEGAEAAAAPAPARGGRSG